MLLIKKKLIEKKTEYGAFLFVTILVIEKQNRTILILVDRMTRKHTEVTANNKSEWVSVWTLDRGKEKEEVIMAREVSEICVDSVLTEMVASYCNRFYPNKPDLAARRIEAIGYQVGHQLSERFLSLTLESN